MRKEIKAKKAELTFGERDECHSTTKRLKPKTPKIETLQELYQLHPNINGQSVWLFPTLKKSAEGRILYEKAENCAYVYDMITQSRFVDMGSGLIND
ncbi:10300_t:CDS:2, partial [Paraglomus occultum]